MRLKSADTLRALMIQAGFTTRMLAEEVGLSHGFIDHLLQGRRENTSQAHARGIAGALGSPVNLLWEDRGTSR